MKVLYKGLLLLVFLSVLALSSSAQNVNTEKHDSASVVKDSVKRVDSIITTRDSIKLYKQIEQYSSKRKSTAFIYRLIFRRKILKPNADTSQAVLSSTYREAECKSIRKILITTYYPLGYSLEDTTFPNILQKAGDKIHVKTLPLTIQNLLLFKKNQPFDSLKIKESERLIKSQVYVHDADIIPVIIPGSDSVDIVVKELDNWTLIPTGGLSSVGFSIGINENNFIGLGQRFDNSYANTFAGSGRNFNSNYYIPNFKNTYITGLIQYGINQRNKYLKLLDIERPFYSPLTKWAGGIYLSSQDQRDSTVVPDTGSTGEYKHFIQDYWVAKAWHIARGNSEDDRTTNFTLATRLYDVIYYQKPGNLVDSLHQFENEVYYLISIGLSTRKYKKERYVFKYGVTEFVPVGKIYDLTGGYDIRNGFGNWYTGAKVSWGEFYKFGYLSPVIQYGTFINSLRTTQQTISVGFNYFTSLLNTGKWKFRQFIKTNSTFGIDHLPYQTISINKDFGIEGFNSPTLTGSNKIVLTLQTQSYAPWSFLGFNFGVPYALLTFAVVGQSQHGFSYSKLYSLFGFGVLIDNEYLVLNAFQVSLGFYPYIPGIGRNLILFDSYKTTDYGFTDFGTTKPAIVPYQ